MTTIRRKEQFKELCRDLGIMLYQDGEGPIIRPMEIVHGKSKRLGHDVERRIRREATRHRSPNRV